MATPAVLPPYSLTTPPLFPAAQLGGLTFDVKRTIAYDTLVQTAASGRETVATWKETPTIHFEVVFEYLFDDMRYGSTSDDTVADPADDYTQLEILEGFFRQLRGQFQPFYLRLADLTQNSADSVLMGQNIGTGDGVTTNFQMVRSIGPTYEIVQNVDAAATITIYVNGAPLSSSGGWAISSQGVLVLSTPPAVGALILADFSWLYLCRMDDDSLDLDQMMYLLYECQSFKFRTVIQ
jgi:uncharacterized protein (TIGR02217 family)